MGVRSWRGSSIIPTAPCAGARVPYQPTLGSPVSGTMAPGWSLCTRGITILKPALGFVVGASAPPLNRCAGLRGTPACSARGFGVESHPRAFCPGTYPNSGSLSAHADVEETQLATAEIFSGICGFTSTVQARMEGSRCVISEVLPRRAALGASERFQDDLGPLRQEVGADTDQSKTTGDHHVPIRHGKVGPVARRTH